MPFMNTAALKSYTYSTVDQLAIHTIYDPQLPLKKPWFLYEANICLHLVTGGFALVQSHLQYLDQIYGMAIFESILAPLHTNINQAVWKEDPVLPYPQGIPPNLYRYPWQEVYLAVHSTCNEPDFSLQLRVLWIQLPQERLGRF